MAIEKANPDLAGKLGFFPIPGKTADTPGAVFTGGSDLIVPEASKNPDLAYEVIKALAGEKFQTDMAKEMSYVPNRVSLGGVLTSEGAVRHGQGRGERPRDAELGELGGGRGQERHQGIHDRPT